MGCVTGLSMVVENRGPKAPGSGASTCCRMICTQRDSMLPSRKFFFFQAEDGIRDYKVTGVTCALPISRVDFTGVGCIDYSCADEIVAKLLRERPAVLVLSGISDAHREAIEPVLAGHGLAALIEGPGGDRKSVV